MPDPASFALSPWAEQGMRETGSAELSQKDELQNGFIRHRGCPNSPQTPSQRLTEPKLSGSVPGGAELPALSVYVTPPAQGQLCWGGRRDLCQIIQHCLSPELGKRRLIHPRQRHGAAEWDLRGEGWSAERLCGNAVFIPGIQHWHFDALSHPEPNPLGQGEPF